MNSAELCDFCNEPGPSWVVPCAPFEAMGAHSPDDWLACTTCAKLVQTNQWNRLLRRVMDSWSRSHEAAMSPFVSETLRLTYNKLREHRTGPVRKR